ncbi:MAG: hypothetical protein BRD57_01785, partial [Proteobacteria bacterium SW_6_67_9]
IHEILRVSDAIMIARGDLGVEIGDAELPAVQKSLIRDARSANVPVITATQMMESMITQPLPTRAEVFDVANAVLDGTDAVMLSAETAAGNYPAEVVQAMGRIALGAERHPSAQSSDHRIDAQFERTDESIAMATMYTANHLGVRAIASLTESGSTTDASSSRSSVSTARRCTPKCWWAGACPTTRASIAKAAGCRRRRSPTRTPPISSSQPSST